MTLDNLVKVTIFLSDRKYTADYRRVRNEVLEGATDRPDRHHHSAYSTNDGCWRSRRSPQPDHLIQITQ